MLLHNICEFVVITCVLFDFSCHIQRLNGRLVNCLLRNYKGIITEEICIIPGQDSSCLHPQCLNMSASVIAQDVFPLSAKSSSIDNVFPSTDASFQQAFLEAHNAYRAKHSTAPMTMNSELSATAQKWADHLLATRTMMHSQTQDGENIYNMFSSQALNLTGADQTFY